MKITGFFANIPFCFIVVFGQAFYSLWVPSQDAHLLTILTILTIQGVVVSGTINPMYSIYIVTNKIKIDALLRILIGFISVGIVYMLLKYTSLGVYAVAGVSTTIGTIFNLIFVPSYVANNCLKIKWYTFYPTIAKYMVTTVILLVVVFGIRTVIAVNKWTMLFIAALVVGILGILINYLLLLNAEDKKEFKNILRKITKKNRDRRDYVE